MMSIDEYAQQLEQAFQAVCVAMAHYESALFAMPGAHAWRMAMRKLLPIPPPRRRRQKPTAEAPGLPTLKGKQQ